MKIMALKKNLKNLERIGPINRFEYRKKVNNRATNEDLIKGWYSKGLKSNPI